MSAQRPMLVFQHSPWNTKLNADDVPHLTFKSSRRLEEIFLIRRNAKQPGKQNQVTAAPKFLIPRAKKFPNAVASRRSNIRIRTVHILWPACRSSRHPRDISSQDSFGSGVGSSLGSDPVNGRIFDPIAYPSLEIGGCRRPRSRSIWTAFSLAKPTNVVCRVVGVSPARAEVFLSVREMQPPNSKTHESVFLVAVVVAAAIAHTDLPERWPLIPGRRLRESVRLREGIEPSMSAPRWSGCREALGRRGEAS